MEEIQWPTAKFTEYVVTTCKQVNRRRAAGNSISSRKVVRIVLTDGNATDSSDDESDDGAGVLLQRVRRYVVEIKFSSSCFGMTKKRWTRERRDSTCRKMIRGVRQRPCGRYATESRYPARGKRICLGTYDMPEEGTPVYDRVSVRQESPAAVTYFHEEIPITETVPESEVVSKRNYAGSSPTSVLRHNDLPPFEFLEFADVGDFGFDLEYALSLPCTRMSEKYLADEFGEFDLDDFVNDLT